VGITSNLFANPVEGSGEIPKPVLKTVLKVGNFITTFDGIISLIFSLKSGEKLIKLLDNEETVKIDNNVKIANRILGSFFLLAIALNILGIVILVNDDTLKQFAISNLLL